MKRILIMTILIIMPICILAEPTPTPTPISDERIKVMVKECAIDIINNTMEGADQNKINDLYSAISVKYGIALTPMSVTLLKAQFGQCILAIEFCNTVAEQDAKFEQFFNDMRTWAK